MHAGIPDFRVFPDPYLGFEEDRARTEAVLALVDDHPLPELLERYWALSDVTPPGLRRRFVRSALRGDDKARRTLAILEDGTFRDPVRAQSVLEVGSGTGAFLAEAARRFPRVVGADIAMRWLHVSRRRFRDLGLPPPTLVCCCAERLPFPDGAFDLAVSTATLEFTRDPQAALAEAARVLRPGTAFVVNTVNRYSLASEPHVGLWAVGFLPRRWQAPYVQWRRRARFENVRLLSLRELRRLAGAHFASIEVAPADVPDATLRTLPARQRALVRAYRLLKRVPPAAALLRQVAPEWDVKLTTPGAGSPIPAPRGGMAW
jgi:SAM-dependent methyltransferase